jgi:hypothetical protein
LRVSRAFAAELDPARPAQARALSGFAKGTADAYTRLEHLDGAIRFAEGIANVAARKIGVPRVVP